MSFIRSVDLDEAFVVEVPTSRCAASRRGSMVSAVFLRLVEIAMDRKSTFDQDLAGAGADFAQGTACAEPSLMRSAGIMGGDAAILGMARPRGCRCTRGRYQRIKYGAIGAATVEGMRQLLSRARFIGGVAEHERYAMRLAMRSDSGGVPPLDPAIDHAISRCRWHGGRPICCNGVRSFSAMVMPE